VAGFPTFDPARGVAVANGFAFVAEDASGVRILDVSDPTLPAEVSAIDTPGTANSVALAGDYAYVADWGGGLQILEVSDPAFPSESGFHETEQAAWAVAISGSRAFIAAENEFLAVDVTDPTATVELGSVGLWSTAASVALAGTRAYVADGFAGLRVLEIGVPASPVQIGALDTAGEALGVAVSGTRAYVADGADGLRIVDVGSPSGPVELGGIDTPGYAHSVALAGTHAYVADGFAGLRVIDVSNPSAPTGAGAYDTPGSALAVAVAGSTAYVADGSAGLRIVDVSNPAAPTSLGSLNTPGTAFGVAVKGTLAYVADYDAGLRIIDVSSPASPVELGFVDTPGNALAVAVAGDRAFVADDTGGMRIIDVSSPSAPVEVAVRDTAAAASHVVIVGGQLALAESDAGVSLWDLASCAQACTVSCSASLSASTGEAPLTVGFTSDVTASGCSGSPTYVWSFGDGTPDDTTASPTHLYATVGTRHWTLTTTVGGHTCVQEGDVHVLAPCVLICSAVVPANGLAGAAVAFNGSATATSCLTPPAFAWTFGDGTAGSSLEDPGHTYTSAGFYPWAMSVAAGTRTCSANGTVAVGGPACSGAYNLIVPAAAKSNGQWQTDLDLLNLGAAAASVDIALLKGGQSNLTPLATNVAVPAGRTVRIADILGTLLPASNAALGLRFCSGTVKATSRFYNVSSKSGGTYGMYVPALPESAALAAGQLGVFQHLTYSPSSTSGYRVNIGFANAVGIFVDVVIKLYGDSGELLGTKSLRLRPFEHTQLTKIHQILGTPAVAHGWASVQISTANAKVHAYAMLIDNISSDPIYMPVEIQ
jgi:hypothetical protein